MSDTPNPASLFGGDEIEEIQGVAVPLGAEPPPLPPRRATAPRVTAAPQAIDIIPPGKKLSHAEAKRQAKTEQTALAAKFTKDMRALWEEQGDSIMRRSAFADPLGTLKVIASMLPKTIDVTTTTVEDIDNDKLEQLLGAVDELLTSRLGKVAADADGGADAPDQRAKAVDV